MLFVALWHALELSTVVTYNFSVAHVWYVVKREDTACPRGEHTLIVLLPHAVCPAAAVQMPERVPHTNGVLDPRLVSIKPDWVP